MGKLSLLKEDIQTIVRKDPANRSYLEALLCYPGLHAIWSHRFAHYLWKHKFYLIARFISQITRFFTGIEIHPGATIGRRLFIDHGMGIVIGETTVIGDDVLLYKGVVLGGTSLKKEKRHPTLGNNIIVGSNAIIMGAITIGDNARIGAASVVTHNIPSNSTAVGIPARVRIEETKEGIHNLEHSKMQDPVADAMKYILDQQRKLEERLAKIEKNNQTSKM